MISRRASEKLMIRNRKRLSGRRNRLKTGECSGIVPFSGGFSFPKSTVASQQRIFNSALKGFISRALAFLLAASCNSFLCAGTRIAAGYWFAAPSLAHDFSARADLRFRIGEGVGLGPMLQAGYSLCHYTDGGSDALVYGPSLSLGVGADWAICDRLEITASADCHIVYALYPTIMRAGVRIGTVHHVSGRFFISPEITLLFAPDKPQVGVGLFAGVFL